VLLFFLFLNFVVKYLLPGHSKVFYFFYIYFFVECHVKDGTGQSFFTSKLFSFLFTYYFDMHVNN